MNVIWSVKKEFKKPVSKFKLKLTLAHFFFLLRAVYHISQKTNLCFRLFLGIPPSQLSFRQYRLWPFY